MAAISIGDCTVTTLGVSGAVKWVKIVTPATADDGDTIDVSSIFHTWCVATVYGSSDGNAVDTGDPIDTSITIPGSTDNEARTIIAYGQ
ncbi:MAG: hypothetical protein DRP29_07155 [Thermodesulfobacteriota bacterium]|nr:MAG: hypothetical protein DRP29_07155 [Thermodesulfobacteriota bacterium]